MIIRSFKPDDADQIANLLNESGYGPVKFNLPLRGKDIEKLHQEKYFLKRFVAEEKNKIWATYYLCKECGERLSDENAIWGGQFVIHPLKRHHKISFDLFFKALHNLEKKIKHVDLRVLPNNLSAYFLYKRLGFLRINSSYDQDGLIKLVNYLPVLFQFASDAGIKLDEKELYDGLQSLTLKKAIRTFKKDSFHYNNIKVVEYEFKIKNSEIIKTLIDISNGEIVFFENDSFLFELRTNSSSVFFPNEKLSLIMNLINKKNHVEEIIISAGKKEKHYVMAAKERKNLMETLSFPKRGIKIVKRELTTKANNFKFHFGLPIKIINPLEIGFIPSSLFLKINQEEKLLLIIKNNSNVEYDLTLQFNPSTPYLKISPNQMEFKLEQKERREFNFHLSADKKVKGEIKLSLMQRNHELISKKEIKFSVREFDELAVINEGGKILIENSIIRYKINLNNGDFHVIKKHGEYIATHKWPQLGPPFIGGFLTPCHRKISAKIKPSPFPMIILNEETNDFIILKTICFPHSFWLKIMFKIIRKSNRDQNTFSQVKCEFRTHLNDGSFYFPYSGSIIKAPIIKGSFPFMMTNFEGTVGDIFILKDKSNWSAWEKDGFIAGLIWQKTEKIEFGNNRMPNIYYSLASQNKTGFPPVMFYFGPGNFKLIKAYYEDFFSINPGPNEEREIEKIKEKIPLILENNSNENEILFTLETLRKQAQKGKIIFDIKNNGEINLKEVFFQNLNFDNPITIKNSLKLNPSQKIVPLKITFSSNHFYKEIIYPIIILGEKDKKPIITNEKEQSKFASLDNNTLIFKIDPKFHGSIFSLSFNNFELLNSSYPQIKPVGVDHKFVGGIHHLTRPIKYNPDQNTFHCFHKNEYTINTIKNEFHGWLGKGFKLSNYNGYWQEEIEYLTFWESNFIYLNLIFINKSEKNFAFRSFLNIYPKFTRKTSLVYINNNEGIPIGERRLIISKKDDLLFEDKTKEIFFLLQIDEQGKITLQDYEKEMTYLSWENKVFLSANSKCQFHGIIAVYNNSLEKELITKGCQYLLACRKSY
jgi:hypothetical protein